MRIFITGGSGFVGANLIQALSDHEVIYTGNQTEQFVKGICLEPGLMGIDLSRLSNIDLVFHQSANNNTLCNDKQEMMHANVVCPKAIFAFCHRQGCNRFIFASSTAIYGDAPSPYLEEITPLKPLNAYSRSKEQFERWAMSWGKKLGINVVGLRYCNVYGPGEDHKGSRASMIHQMLKKAKKGEKIKLFKYGEQRRDWVHVKDVVRANLLAANYNGCNLFNVGSGISTSFNSINDLINKYIKTQIEWIDNPNIDTYQDFTLCNIDKARELLDWVPERTIEEYIKEESRI